MDNRRAMTVKRAFRIAGRARGVAEAGGGALVEFRPLERIRFASYEIFIRVGHRDEGLDALELRPQLLDQRRERRVEEKYLVFRVVRDVGDLVGEEPRIDRMDHC